MPHVLMDTFVLKHVVCHGQTLMSTYVQHQNTAQIREVIPTNHASPDVVARVGVEVPQKDNGVHR